jgi:branched-chain amino acid transport system permease protein
MLTRRIRLAGLAILLGIALVLPLVMDNLYLLGIVITTFITAIAVYGLNVLLGYTGQLSLAHAGFFGIGGYTAGILMVDHGFSFWLALPVSLVFTCVVGFLVGMIALRTKASYFAIFTLAVGVIITIIIDRWEDMTGGTDGLIGVPPPDPIGPLRFDSMTGIYYLVLFFLVLTIYLVWALINSLVGRTFIAVRNSEDLARTIGIDVGRAKRLSFTITCGFAGLAGALYATYLGYIGPGMSSLVMTFNMLLFLMLGGVASLSGPLIGTVVISTLMQALQAFEEYQLAILGPILVMIMIFFPQGIAGLWAAYEERWRVRRLREASGTRGERKREEVHVSPSGEPRD